MFKKIYIYPLLLLIAVLAFNGCSSIQVAKSLNGQKITAGNEKPIAHIYANNYGYYLFNCIPMIAGDPDDIGSFTLLSRTVTAENTIDMLTKKAEELGATKIVNIQTKEEQYGWFTLWISWYRCVQASGNAVIDKPENLEKGGSSK